MADRAHRSSGTRVGRDHPGHAPGADLTARGGRRRRRSLTAARACRAARRGGHFAGGGRAPGHRGRGWGAARRRGGRTRRRRGGAPRPGGLHPGRQGRLQLGPSAVRAVVGGGRGDHRAAGRRRRLAGDRLLPGRGDQQLLHPAATRPGHTDRRRAAGAGVQRDGVGYPGRRQARAGWAAGPVDPPAGRRAGREDGRHTARPGARPARRSGRGSRRGGAGRDPRGSAG